MSEIAALIAVAVLIINTIMNALYKRKVQRIFARIEEIHQKQAQERALLLADLDRKLKMVQELVEPRTG